MKLVLELFSKGTQGGLTDVFAVFDNVEAVTNKLLCHLGNWHGLSMATRMEPLTGLAER